jgi:hypothetical protein
MGSMIQGLNPCRIIHFSVFQNVSTSHLFSGYWGFFPWVKQPGREVDSSPASGAKDENVWSYVSSPSVCLHGMAGTSLSPRRLFSPYYVVFCNCYLNVIYWAKCKSKYTLLMVEFSRKCNLSFCTCPKLFLLNTVCLVFII